MWYIVSLNGDQECISSKQEKAMELNPPCAHGCSKLQTSCWCETGAELKVFPHRAGVPLAGCRAAEQSAFSGLARKTIKQQQTHSLKHPLLPVKEGKRRGVQSQGYFYTFLGSELIITSRSVQIRKRYKMRCTFILHSAGSSHMH